MTRPEPRDMTEAEVKQMADDATERFFEAMGYRDWLSHQRLYNYYEGAD